MPRIMVVDDNDLVLKMMAGLLEEEGYEVRAFPDAAFALESALDDIELIVTDLDMPTPGEALIQQVRRESDIPIIVVSGNISEERAQFLRNIGAQTVLEKPFSLSGFLETIRQFSPVSP